MATSKQFLSAEEIDLSESLDKIIDYKLVKTISQSGVEGFWYEIQSEPKLTVAMQLLSFQDKNVAEVSFYSEKTEFQALRKFNSGEAGSVLGTVIDICEKQKDVDIWFFSAKFVRNLNRTEQQDVEEFSKRKSLYIRVSQRYARQHSLFFKTFSHGSHQFYIVSQEEVNKEFIIAFSKIW